MEVIHNMKKSPKTALPHTWNSILESSKHKAGDKIFEKIRKDKNLNSVLRSSYHNFSKQVSPQVEKDDLSPQLNVLKNSLDLYRSQIVNNEKQSWNLKLENSRVSEICESTKLKLESLEEKARKLNESVEFVRDKQGVNLRMRSSLFHVFDRMRTTLVFLKEKKRVLWENLHLQDFSLENNKKRSVKVKDSLQITTQALEVFQNSVENEKLEKAQELQEIKANLELRQKLAKEKEEHLVNEKFMTEQILINDQSTALETLRKQFFSHFLWYMVSSQHFEKEKIRFKVYEDAYSKIKLATGISDVPQFVDKFLTKEQRYSEFVTVIKDKEVKVLGIKYNIEKVQKIIDDIKAGNRLALENENRGCLPNAYRIAQKSVIENLVKLKKLKLMKKKVLEWVKLIAPKLSDTLQIPESDNLCVQMVGLKNLVISTLHSKLPGGKNKILLSKEPLFQ